MITHNVLTTALTYWAGGLSVIPVGRDKKPLCAWKPFQERPAGQGQIRAWFGRQEPPNLGIVCGRVSGGLLVLDFDHLAGQTYQQWRVLVGSLAGKLPVVKTGKGLHVYLRATDPGPNCRLAMDRDGRVLIETRGEGGYVITPPSCHPSGRYYRWVQGDHEIPRLSAGALERVLEGAMALDDRPGPQNRSGETGMNPDEGLRDEKRLRRYAHAVLAREATRLAVTPVGSRNHRLNRAAFKAGRYAGSGLLSPQLIEDMLVAACAAGGNNLIPDDGPDAFRATLQSGLQAGMVRGFFLEALLKRLDGHEDSQ